MGRNYQAVSTPDGCKETQIAPLDQVLEIEPCQQTSWELVQMGCLLTVFLPFETVRIISAILILKIK